MCKWSQMFNRWQNHAFDESKLLCQTVKFQDLFKTWPIFVLITRFWASFGGFKKVHWYLFNKKISLNYTGNYFSIKNRRKCVVNLWNWFYQNRSVSRHKRTKTRKIPLPIVQNESFSQLNCKADTESLSNRLLVMIYDWVFFWRKKINCSIRRRHSLNDIIAKR